MCRARARLCRPADREEGVAPQVPGEEEEQARRGRSVPGAVSGAGGWGGQGDGRQGCAGRRRRAVARRQLRAPAQLKDLMSRERNKSITASLLLHVVLLVYYYVDP